MGTIPSESSVLLLLVVLLVSVVVQASPIGQAITHPAATRRPTTAAPPRHPVVLQQKWLLNVSADAVGGYGFIFSNAAKLADNRTVTVVSLCLQYYVIDVSHGTLVATINAVQGNMCFDHEAIVDERRVITASPAGLHAWDVLTGAMVYQAAGVTSQYSPVASRDTIVAISSANHVVAVDRESGLVKWRYTFPDLNMSATFVSSPAVGSGIVAVPTTTTGGGSMLYGFDEVTGNLSWAVNFTHAADGQSVSGTLTYHRGLFFVSVEGGGLVAVDAGTGTLKWTVFQPFNITWFGTQQKPAFLGNVAMMIEMTNVVNNTLVPLGIDIGTGKILWQTPSIGSPFMSNPSSSEDDTTRGSSTLGNLFWVNTHDAVHGIDPVTGNVLVTSPRAGNAGPKGEVRNFAFPPRVVARLPEGEGVVVDGYARWSDQVTALSGWVASQPAV